MRLSVKWQIADIPLAQTLVVTRTFSLPSRKRSMTAALCSTCISPLSSATWWPSLDSSPASHPAVFLVWYNKSHGYVLLLFVLWKTPQYQQMICIYVAEDHGLCDSNGSVDVAQSLELLLLAVADDVVLLDSVQSFLLTLQFNDVGVGNDPLSEVPHGVFKCGREQQHLTSFRKHPVKIQEQQVVIHSKIKNSNKNKKQKQYIKQHP